MMIAAMTAITIHNGALIDTASIRLLLDFVTYDVPGVCARKR